LLIIFEVIPQGYPCFVQNCVISNLKSVYVCVFGLINGPMQLKPLHSDR